MATYRKLIKNITIHPYIWGCIPHYFPHYSSLLLTTPHKPVVRKIPPIAAVLLVFLTVICQIWGVPHYLTTSLQKNYMNVYLVIFEPNRRYFLPIGNRCR
jgi:hypothetical protein